MIIGVMPCIAGAGATSISLAAGALLAERGSKVSLVDADPAAELSALLDVRPERPMVDLLSWGGAAQATPGAVSVAERLQVIPMHQGRFIAQAAPPRASLKAALDGQRSADVVIVDLAPAGQPITTELLALIDALLLVVPARGAGLRALPGVLRLLLSLPARERPELAAVAVTMGRAGDPSQQASADVRRALGEAVPVLELPWQARIEASALAQKPPPHQLFAPSFDPLLSRAALRGEGAPSARRAGLTTPMATP